MSPRALLASAWTLVILVLCLFPAHWLPLRESGASASHYVAHPDKIIHFGMFAALSFFWMRVRPTRNWTARVFVGGLALAILTEIGQGLPMIARDPELIDALSDSAGVIAGIGAFLALRGSGASSPAEELERTSTADC